MSKNKSITIAFTLIELLVVIGIISILMAILFPAINAAKEQGRKTRAKSEVKQLELAWKSLLMDSRKWPFGPGTLTNTPTVMDRATSAMLASNNPQRLTYFEFTLGTNAYLYDPWKMRPYRLAFDMEYDNIITISRGSGKYATNVTIGRAVGIWSEGSNANDPGDDVTSW